MASLGRIEWENVIKNIVWNHTAIIGVGPGSYYYNGKTEGNDETGTEYGSMEGSYPPSPTLSFRSAIDGAGFSRFLTFTLFFC